MTKTKPFDEQTDEYDAWFEKHPDLYQAELEALRSFIPPRGSGIEIGVGTGRFASPLGISIGVEPAPRMAELARLRGVEVLEGIAEALPFADESFDFAIMVTVICFLDDVALAFREACRILKPNGTFVIGFIDRESELGQLYSQKKEHSHFYRDATFYSVSDLVVLLNKTGFCNFAYRQTLMAGENTDLSVREGYGSGGFVVIQAHKQHKKCVCDEADKHPIDNSQKGSGDGSVNNQKHNKSDSTALDGHIICRLAHWRNFLSTDRLFHAGLHGCRNGLRCCKGAVLVRLDVPARQFS